MQMRNVGFGEAVRLGFRKYVQFGGRSQRAEFWWFCLFCLIGTYALMIFDVVVLGVKDPTENFSPTSDLFSLATIIPLLSLGWRRMHDIGKSGWWSILPLAPMVWAGVAAVIMFTSSEELTLVGIIVIGLGLIATIATYIYVIVLFATDSDIADNRFGPSVKYRNTDDEFQAA